MGTYNEERGVYGMHSAPHTDLAGVAGMLAGVPLLEQSAWSVREMCGSMAAVSSRWVAWRDICDVCPDVLLDGSGELLRTQRDTGHVA